MILENDIIRKIFLQIVRNARNNDRISEKLLMTGINPCTLISLWNNRAAFGFTCNGDIIESFALLFD